jgi:hypothetical protein
LKRKWRARTDNLDLDIDLDEALAERIDLDETGINSSVKTTEFRDEADVSLRDGLVWIRADDTAWNRAHSTDTASQTIDYDMLESCKIAQGPSASLTHASIPAMVSLVALAGEGLCITRLEIFTFRRLDLD